MSITSIEKSSACNIRSKKKCAFTPIKVAKNGGSRAEHLYNASNLHSSPPRKRLLFVDQFHFTDEAIESFAQHHTARPGQCL